VLSRTIQGVILAFLALLSGAASAQSIPAMTVIGPAEVVGDGVTPIQVRVNLDQHGPRDLEALKVDVSAGRFAGKRELAAGSLEVTLVPPRVVEAVVLTVEIQSRRGQRGKAEIRLLPAIAPAKVRASNGPLDLQVPEHMILGYDQEGIITFRAKSLSPVTLRASAGSISSPQREAGNIYRAVYRPPAEKLPRIVVIVAASEDGSIVDFAPIKLYGRPLVSATSEPHATVLTRVAGAVYGPFQADSRGRVELRVLAPPGVSEAQTVARDALGNERALTLKLGVSPVHESFAICPSTSEALYYFAVGADGVPRKDLRIQVDSTLGKLSPPHLTDGGYYSAPLALPPDATLGEAVSLTAQINGEADSRVVCDMAVAGEAPERLRLSVVPASWVADSDQPLRIQARASYSGKRKPRAVPLWVEADFGEVSLFQSQNVELFEATWRMPAKLDGRRQAKLQVQTVGPRPVKSEIVIELRPGAPRAMKVTAEPGNLKSDGRSEAQLTVHVFDAHGNPVDVAPELVEAKGTVSPFTAVSAGVFTATYRAPQSSLLERDDVSVRAGKTSAIGSVHIGLTPASDRWRLWGAIGYSSNFAKVHAPMGAVGGGVRLPVLRESVIVGVDVAYLASQTNQLDSTGQESVSIKTTVVPVSARATYELRVSRFRPYLGAGGGVGMVRLDISSPSSGRYIRWKAHSVVSGLIGTLVRIGPGSALIEAGYRYIPVSEPTVSGNAGGLSATAGYLYEF
jgi:hypothetical protein